MLTRGQSGFNSPHFYFRRAANSSSKILTAHLKFAIFRIEINKFSTLCTRSLLSVSWKKYRNCLYSSNAGLTESLNSCHVRNYLPSCRIQTILVPDRFSHGTEMVTLITVSVPYDHRFGPVRSD